MSRRLTTWWRGRRGEWFVAGQLVLMALVFLGPHRWFGWPAAPLPFEPIRRVLGVGLILAGGALFIAGLFHLGPSLTPLPYPKDRATLVETGAYALVRHPIYAGGLIATLGWALCVGTWITLGYVVSLFVLLDRKARREELWLEERFAGYAAYKSRVRRLVPFVY